jgi:hypothetical protein
MNGPNTPLRPGTLDELLSADIDGELERAAADHGLTLDDARAAIGTAGAVARRAALVRARDLVAPTVPLEPAAVDRLVGGALDRAREESELAAARRRRNRIDAARRVALAAASIVVIFGGLAVLARGSTSSNPSASKSGTASPANAASGAPEAASSVLGDVSTPDALRAKVLQRLRVGHAGTESLPAAIAALPDRGDENGTATGLEFDAAGNVSARQLARLTLIGPKGLVIPESAMSDRAAASVRPSQIDCVVQLVQSGRVPPVPAFSGTGTSGGQTVYVAVFRSGGGYDAYVLRATDCSVLRRTVV